MLPANREPIQVPAPLAKAFNAATPAEQDRALFLLELGLSGLDHKDTEGSLPRLMDEIGREARERGLTPELLEQILNDE